MTLICREHSDAGKPGQPAACAGGRCLAAAVFRAGRDNASVREASRRILRRTHLRRAGRIRLAKAPAKTLIKLLAVQPGHALHREQIIDVLWSGADAESALNSFGKALHAARRALEPGLPRRQDSAYLRLTDAMLVLNTEHVVVDMDQFEQLAENAIHRGEIEAYEAALAVYGGELLPEDRYESWCSDRADRLGGVACPAAARTGRGP